MAGTNAFSVSQSRPIRQTTQITTSTVSDSSSTGIHQKTKRRTDRPWTGKYSNIKPLCMTRISGLFDLAEDDDGSVFETLQTTHETLSQLRAELPRLLQRPLTLEQVIQSHCEDTLVIVRGKASGSGGAILVSSVQELVSLQNALTYIAVLGPLRAQTLLENALQQEQQQRTQMDAAPWVKCKLILLNDTPNETDHNDHEEHSRIQLDQIQVDWKVPLVAPTLLGSGGTTRKALRSRINKSSDENDDESGPNIGGVLQGCSVLELRDGKVARHELRRIQLDGQTVDPAIIGGTLGQARKLVTQVQESSPEWLKEWVVPNVRSLWQQYAKPWILQDQPQPIDDDDGANGIERMESMNRTKFSSKLAPLFVQETGIGEGKNETRYVPIDEASKNRTFPLPGSMQWSEYASRHSAVVDFVDRIVPQLANPAAASSSSTSMTSLFTPQCKLIAPDRTSILVQGDTQMSDFYTSLATLRRRTRGVWTLQGAQLVTPLMKTTTNPRVRIEYQIQYPDALITTTSASSVMSGCDLYTLQILNITSSSSSSTRRNTRIAKIQQESLTIAGNSNPVDATLFMRSLVATIKNPNSAFLTKTADDSSWFVRLWELAAVPQPQQQLLNPYDDDSAAKLATRSDAAAALIYRLLVSLHTQGKQLVRVDSTTTTTMTAPIQPPGVAYMSDQVQLLGYLGETLVRGKPRYQQNVGLLVASLTTSLRSGRVVSEKPPITKVEWTDTGTIQYTLTLNLRLVLTPGFAPGEMRFLRTASSNNPPPSSSTTTPTTTTTIPGATLPLKITLRSEYSLDDTTGLIIKHRLLESLVNGQLTPADILSRWLRGASSSSSGDSSSSTSLWSPGDFIQWVRTVAPKQ